MGNNNTTYSDKEIYDALKMIRDICKNNGGSCRDCKLSYSENDGIHVPYCGVGDTPDVWRLIMAQLSRQKFNIFIMN